MFKIMLILILSIGTLQATSDAELIGSWYSSLRTVNNGTETIEKEYLTFNANNTFKLILLVNLKKDLSYVKDLRIEVIGNWEAKGNALIYVIKSVNVPSAKEVYQISQQSLEQVAANFKYRYENDKIHINKIILIKAKKMSILSEKGRTTNYSRQYY
jgi:hypothetical protein